jgi:hypothetical protein
MEIDHDVEPFATQLQRGAHIIGHPTRSATKRNDDDVIQVWVAVDDGSGPRLDHVRKMGVGIMPPQSSNERCCEDHITDEPRPYQQDIH